MKNLKIVLLGGMLLFGSLAVSLACSVAECGGGNDKCCEKSGALYFINRGAQVDQ